MLQRIASDVGYVVEFEEMPLLPITGTGMDQYYAEALTDALRNGIVSKPGKYFIVIEWSHPDKPYQIAEVIENS